jgi:hypothetical protein
MRRDPERAIVNGLDEPGVAGDDGSPNAPVTIDGSEHTHLPAVEKLTGAWWKVIGDAFADILRDVAYSSPFLDRNFTAMKPHRLLGRG